MFSNRCIVQSDKKQWKKEIVLFKNLFLWKLKIQIIRKHN